MNDAFDQELDKELVLQQEIDKLRSQLEQANNRLQAIADRRVVEILLFNKMPDSSFEGMHPKIAAIKYLRQEFDWGLKESKDYVETKCQDWGMDLLNLGGRVREQEDGSFTYTRW